MTEGRHQRRHVNVECRALVVAPGLPEGMRPEIPLEIERSTPPLDHAVDGNGRDGLPATLRPKQRFVVGSVGTGDQVTAESLGAVAVHDYWPDLAGLLLSQVERLAGLEVPHMPDRDPGEVAGAEVGVYADHEQRQVARLVGQNFFDGANVLGFADGIDGDDGPFSGVVGIGHSPSCFCANLSKYNTKLLALCQSAVRAKTVNSAGDRHQCWLGGGRRFANFRFKVSEFAKS